jgi:hypothetical protein
MGLPGDRETENTVREVLEVMSAHSGEWMRPADIAGSLRRACASISVILSCLASGHVLRADGDRYRYVSDPVVELDVQRFMRRSGAHSQLAQNNLARFRDRYGYR